MKAKRVLILSVLVLIGITIGHVLADGRSRRAGIRPAQYRPANITGHGRVRTTAEVSRPGQVTLSARASLLTSILQHPQWWFAEIRTYDGKKHELVWRQEYVEQRFVMPINEEYAPTFSETVPLQPGLYKGTVGIRDQQQSQAGHAVTFTVR
jgi:hypothetical protein